MLFPVERLIADRGAPLCIRRNQTIREALTLMVEHDYSQLPVVDEQGELVGLISDEIINRRYFHAGGLVALIDLSVDHCLVPAVKLPKDADIFNALDDLKEVYAIVIVEANRPVGIITDYDMAHFFRDLTGDLLIVEDIETSLRQIVQTVLADEEAMNAALIAKFGEDKENPGQPRRDWDHLSFGDLIYLIMHDVNWPWFRAILSPKELFHQYMDQVRQHRNQLAHFRGRLDVVQRDLLKAVQHWLEMRPNLPVYRTIHVQDMVQVQETDVQGATQPRPIGIFGRYDPLHQFLQEARLRGESRINMEFEDIERLVADELPESARQHRSWWANQHDNTQAAAWLGAGWLVDGVDLTREEANFRQSRKAFYPIFFDQLIRGLKAQRPGITTASSVSMGNWFLFSAGVAGFLLGWALPREPVLRAELYIDSGDKEANKQAFDMLYDQQEDIEAMIGVQLTWERLDDKQASRISTVRPFDISDPHDNHQGAIDWGIDMILKFHDTFVPTLRRI